MATPYFDITRKLQEFGFGPSDSESEDEEDSQDVINPDQNQSIAYDWESIGLLPSWQKLQITFRNASYSFMTGLRRESLDLSSAANKGAECGEAATLSKTIATPTVNSNEASFAEPEANDAGIKPLEPADESGGKPVSGGIKSGIILDNEKNIGSEPQHDDEAREGNAGENESGEEEPEDEDDEEEDDDDEEEEEDEQDDEWEEIGRLPRFNQLAFPSFRNPTDIINFPSVFNYQGEPSSLAARGLAWQNLMPNFQLSSFFDENSDGDNELEDINDPRYADIFTEEGLTEENKTVGYNEEGLTGCQHYLRNCKSECSQCHKFYMCPLCHDEVESHHMDRQSTRRMLCLHCFKPQPPRRSCRFCKEVMGDYYCKICKLWNDDPDKSIYHCDKCGICRVGRGLGIDVFHCDKCGICMNLSVMDNHKCIEQAAKSDCPICLEDLFTSPRPTVFMPCGHPIHKECFDEYSKRYYRCPVCSRSILNTSALFRMIDEEIQYEVLPPELADKLVNIICRDCHLKSQTKYHLAGLKCETCGSYNTAQL